MSLYAITYDSETDYVEASTYGTAIEAWSAYMKHENGPDWPNGEEPESCVLVSGKDVVQARAVLLGAPAREAD
jgi:hypothetical protein